MEYNQLKASIAAVIKTNNRKEITGQLLQNVLFQMTNVIGENLQLAGFATPLTDPHEPDQNLFYITDQGGVYPHFDNLTVDDGLTFLMWKNGEWTSHTVGVVTQEWVDSHYVSIDFFRSLFRAYDSAGLEILPNNNPEDALPTVVDNIKAMVGFWTEQYISALGQQTGGGGGGGATSLDELSDVFLTNPSLGQALVFTITPDHPEGIWVNQTIQAGTDMATVWAALAGNTTQQINISHLTDALADYATKTYVDQNFITVAYFDRLFRAYNGNTLVSHNDVTSTIDNIKAMFGFWTEQYLSSLGNNSGGGGQLLALSNMADVTLTTPIADKQVLTFDAVTQKWVNGNAQAGATALANLTDVLITSPQTNQVLIYDYTTSKWLNSQLKTVNGYSLIGSGNIDASGGGSGNYVAKAGDTMTGALTFNTGSGAAINFPQYMLGYNINNDFFFYTTNNISFAIWTNGQKRLKIGGDGNIGMNVENPTCALDISGATLASWYSFRANNGNALGFIGNGDSSSNVSIANYTTGSIDFVLGSSFLIGMRITSSGYVGIGNTSPAYKLDVNGDVHLTNCLRFYYGNYLDEYSCVHQIASNDTWIIFSHTNRTNLAVVSGSGYVGIGTAAPSYALHVAGTIYATGAITALSDARKKDIMGEAGLSVEQIAHAPAVQFLWKDKERRKDGQQVGTLAQYWQTVLPEVVSDKGGELSMQYGVAALVSSIIIARKVANHEVRIDKMEKWMKKWAEENDE